MAIDGSLRISKQLGISKLFIGLTIISIGTSLPEIFTHIASSLSILKGLDASGVAVGTNIGSNIIQITLILGLVGLLAKVKSSKTIQKRDGLIMLGGIALLWLLGLNGFISRLEGAVLAGLYIIYLFYLSRKEKNLEELFEFDKSNSHNKLILSKQARHNIVVASGVLVAGIAVLLLTSKLVVDNALFLANFFGIAQTLIGTMVIGVSTALPELTTALMGIKRGAKNLSLGVLIGSNITNPMLALGIGAAISGYTMAKELLWVDLPFWFAISAIALLFFQKDHRLSKPASYILIISYVGFVVYKFYSGVL